MDRTSSVAGIDTNLCLLHDVRPDSETGRHKVRGLSLALRFFLHPGHRQRVVKQTKHQKAVGFRQDAFAVSTHLLPNLMRGASFLFPVRFEDVMLATEAKWNEFYQLYGPMVGDKVLRKIVGFEDEVVRR